MSEQNWFCAIIDQLKKSGTFSNVILGFIEVVGEKFLEVEFSCPCKPIINWIYSLGFFLLPALLSFVLIRISQNCTDCTKRYKRCVTALVPAVVWLLITFLDGRYFVCLIAYGRGTFNGSRHTEGLAQPCNMKAETMTENETLDLIKQYTAISQISVMSEMGTFKKLDDTTFTILKAANISEGLLHTLSRDDIRDLFPGPEHFLRRRSIWQMIHPEEQASNSGHPQSLSDGSSASPSNEPPQTNLQGATSLKGATPKKRATPKKVLQLPSPEYVIYTDTELEQVRKHYFEMKNIGREGGCTLSKELRCRLVRNTMTNMVSILRATVEAEDVRYPSKEEITAMAKRLVEYYPMLQDKPGGSKHSWVTLFRQLYKRLQNIRSPQRTQGPTPERGRRRKRRRIDFGTSSEQGDGTSTEEYDADSSASTVILDASPARSSTPERATAKLQNLSDRIDENRSTDQDSQQAQARHYRTLQEVYKRPKPNKDAVAQLLDLEFEARRAFIDSDTLKDQDRPAKIIEAYPCFKDLNHVLGELCRIVSKDNTAYIKEVKERWDTFQSQAVFYGIMKKVMKPPMTFNTEERAINMLKSLPAMFPSAVAPPKKLGRESEALLHVLMPSEDPNTYLQRRPLSCPVLIVDKENCMVAIGTTPVATFPKNHLYEGALYLMAYYYALHMTYPKCIATLLSVLQTEVLQDEIHERDTTSSYRKAMAEWKKFIGE